MHDEVEIEVDIDPELHRKIVEQALASGVCVNDLMVEFVEQGLKRRLVVDRKQGYAREFCQNSVGDLLPILSHHGVPEPSPAVDVDFWICAQALYNVHVAWDMVGRDGDEAKRMVELLSGEVSNQTFIAQRLRERIALLETALEPLATINCSDWPHDKAFVFANTSLCREDVENAARLLRPAGTNETPVIDMDEESMRG